MPRRPRATSAWLDGQVADDGDRQAAAARPTSSSAGAKGTFVQQPVQQGAQDHVFMKGRQRLASMAAISFRGTHLWPELA